MAAVVVYFFRSFIESLSSRQLCSGGMHTIALTKSGEVLSWGCNDEGGLGRDTPEDEDCFLPGKVRTTILVSKTANFDNDNIYM